jgi:hypothetical protein
MHDPAINKKRLRDKSFNRSIFESYAFGRTKSQDPRTNKNQYLKGK